MRSVKRARHVDARGHVDEGEQRRAVGKRLRGAFEHRAVAPVDAAIHAHAQIGQPRDGAAQIDPRLVLRRKHAAGADHRVDMRVLGGEVLRQLPHLGEGAVVQLEAAVRAEHRDALLEGVEGFALHAGERIHLRFELHALAHIVEQISDAAARIGIDRRRAACAGRAGATRSRLDSTER